MKLDQNDGKFYNVSKIGDRFTLSFWEYVYSLSFTVIEEQ